MNLFKKQLFPRDHHHLPIFLALMALLLALPVLIIGINTSHQVKQDAAPLDSPGLYCDSKGNSCPANYHCNYTSRDPKKKLQTGYCIAINRCSDSHLLCDKGYECKPKGSGFTCVGRKGTDCSYNDINKQGNCNNGLICAIVGGATSATCEPPSLANNSNTVCSARYAYQEGPCSHGFKCYPTADNGTLQCQPAENCKSNKDCYTGYYCRPYAKNSTYGSCISYSLGGAIIVAPTGSEDQSNPYVPNTPTPTPLNQPGSAGGPNYTCGNYAEQSCVDSSQYNCGAAGANGGTCAPGQQCCENGHSSPKNAPSAGTQYTICNGTTLEYCTSSGVTNGVDSCPQDQWELNSPSCPAQGQSGCMIAAGSICSQPPCVAACPQPQCSVVRDSTSCSATGYYCKC